MVCENSVQSTLHKTSLWLTFFVAEHESVPLHLAAKKGSIVFTGHILWPLCIQVIKLFIVKIGQNWSVLDCFIMT